MGGLGMPEIMVIMVIALIVFGPRKLPELGKTIGKAMGQFRRASDDFKRTWEQEVDIEKAKSYISDTASIPYVSSNDTYENQQDNSYENTYGYNAPSDDAVNHLSDHNETGPEPEAVKSTTETTSKQGQWI